MSGFFPQSNTVTSVSSAQALLIRCHPLLNLEIHKVIHSFVSVETDEIKTERL